MTAVKLFCPDFQLCKIASLSDFDLSGEERMVLGLGLLLLPGLVEVPVLQGMADAGGQNVGAREEQ